MSKKELTAVTAMVVALLFAFGTYRYFATRESFSHGSDSTGWCRGNLKVIALAIENYDRIYGCYPDSLERLTPHYLRKIPICAAAGADTYSNSYTCDQTHRIYTIYCRGEYHPGLGANLPRYDSRRGLTPRK